MNHFLRPSDSFRQSRPRSAIAVIVLYSVLLFFILVTYFRLLYTVTTNPGYVPRGSRWYALNTEHGKQREPWQIQGRAQGNRTQQKPHHSSKEGKITTRGNSGGLSYGSEPAASRPNFIDEVSPDLQEIYKRDIFTCEGNGRPIWCEHCLNWKPDRAHHCSEVGRCVRKMDHFCPWLVPFFL